MNAVERTKQIEHNLPARRILIHSDFLTDYSLLLFNGLLSKKRILNKIKQNFERFIYL